MNAHTTRRPREQQPDKQAMLMRRTLRMGGIQITFNRWIHLTPLQIDIDGEPRWQRRWFE